MKNPFPKVSAMQFAFAFHKFIHKQRNNGNPEDWNKHDEEAYQAALTGIFELKEDKDMEETKMKTGALDPQVVEQLNMLNDIIEELTKMNTILVTKLGPILSGGIPNSSSSVNTDYVDKLCPLAKDLYHYSLRIQEIVSSLHITTLRLQI